MARSYRSGFGLNQVAAADNQTPPTLCRWIHERQLRRRCVAAGHVSTDAGSVGEFANARGRTTTRRLVIRLLQEQTHSFER